MAVAVGAIATAAVAAANAANAAVAVVVLACSIKLNSKAHYRLVHVTNYGFHAT